MYCDTSTSGMMPLLREWHCRVQFELLTRIFCLVIWSGTALGQVPERLIIFQSEALSPLIAEQTTSLVADCRVHLGISDILLLSPAGGVVPGHPNTRQLQYADIAQGLLILEQVIQAEPGRVPLIAFICEPGAAPTADRVAEVLGRCTSVVKVLVNACYRSDLSELHQSERCGNLSLFHYTRGFVSPEDSVVEEKDFPVVPVVIGSGAAVTTTGIIILTRGGSSGEDCVPVSAEWVVPELLCQNDPGISLTVTGTPGGTWSGTGISPSGVFDPSAGSQSITYTVGEGRCVMSRTRMITVDEPADASWTAPSGVCIEESVMLTPTGTTGGTWSGPGVTDNGDGTAFFSRSSAGTYVVTYTVGEGNCADALTHEIVVDQADASWNVPAPVCAGQSISLIPAGTPGGTWSGTGVTDHGDGTATFTPSDPGTYTVTYAVGEGACANATTQEIDVDERPDATWQSPGNLCAGEQLILSPSGTAGGTWSGHGVTDNGDGTGVFELTEVGTFSVTYTVGSGQCQEALTLDIVVLDQGDASWEVPEDLCPGERIMLIPTGTPGGSWSGEGITDLGNGTASFAHESHGTYLVTYVAGPGSCADTSAREITVLQQDDAAWTSPGVICSGAEVILVPDATFAGSWSGEGVTDQGNGTAVFSREVSGKYAVSFTTTGQCPDTVTQTVTVIDQADASWTVPDQPCVNETVDLIPDGSPGGMWSGQGVIDNGDGTGSFTQTGDGSYPVTYTVGEGACADSLTQEIMVVPLPDASWSPPDDPLCPGAILELQAPEGMWSGENVIDFGDGTGEFQADDEGTYTITLIVGEDECQASESHDVVVGDAEPPVITVPPADQEVECDGAGNSTEFQTWLDNNGGAMADDGCGGPVDWTPDFVDPGTSCPDIDVTFTACDESGNCVSAAARFSITDVTPPVLENVPGDVAAPCDAIPEPVVVTASDICSGSVEVTMEEVVGAGCPYEVIRMYSAIDDCGNSTEEQQVITVFDDEPPVADPLPHIEVFCEFPCDDCLPPPESDVFTDNCDTDVDVTVEDIPLDIQPDFQLWQRIYTGTDDCGNQGMTEQQIMVQCTGSQPAVTLMPAGAVFNQSHWLADVLQNAEWEDHQLDARNDLTMSLIMNKPSIHTEIYFPWGRKKGFVLGINQSSGILHGRATQDAMELTGTYSMASLSAQFRYWLLDGPRVFVSSGLLGQQITPGELVLHTAQSSHQLQGRYVREWDMQHLLTAGYSQPIMDGMRLQFEMGLVHDGRHATVRSSLKCVWWPPVPGGAGFVKQVEE